MSKPYRVLLLASSCGDDDPTCTDDLPCLDCLKMCNIVTMDGDVTNNAGGWEYSRDVAAADGCRYPPAHKAGKCCGKPHACHPPPP